MNNFNKTDKTLLLILVYFLIMVIFLIYTLCNRRRRSHDHKERKKINPRGDHLTIACLVICTESRPRWKMEKKLWQETRVPSNVDVYILDCDDINNDLDCVESFSPGIYQKSLQAFRMAVQKKYDLYIRTNANTHIDFEMINQMGHPLKQQIKSCDPFYTGGFIFEWGISGTSITLNHAAASKLVQRGFDHKYYHAKYPDDVAIANVLKDVGILPTQNKGFAMHVWNHRNDFQSNDTARVRNNAPFVRIRDVSLSKERSIRRHLENIPKG